MWHHAVQYGSLSTRLHGINPKRQQSLQSPTSEPQILYNTQLISRQSLIHVAWDDICNLTLAVRQTSPSPGISQQVYRAHPPRSVGETTSESNRVTKCPDLSFMSHLPTAHFYWPCGETVKTGLRFHVELHQTEQTTAHTHTHTHTHTIIHSHTHTQLFIYTQTVTLTNTCDLYL